MSSSSFSTSLIFDSARLFLFYPSRCVCGRLAWGEGGLSALTSCQFLPGPTPAETTNHFALTPASNLDPPIRWTRMALNCGSTWTETSRTRDGRANRTQGGRAASELNPRPSRCEAVCFALFFTLLSHDWVTLIFSDRIDEEWRICRRLNITASLLDFFTPFLLVAYTQKHIKMCEGRQRVLADSSLTNTF